jgi:hypothetical protein
MSCRGVRLIAHLFRPRIRSTGVGAVGREMRSVRCGRMF